MHLDYPEIIRNGKINRAGVYRESDTGTLTIKFLLDPKPPGSVERREGKADR
jgi:hypothetical protein